MEVSHKKDKFKRISYAKNQTRKHKKESEDSELITEKYINVVYIQ